MAPTWKNKKYKLDHSENFEEFLTAIGINYFLRKIILASSSVIELVELEDGEYLLKQQTSFKNMDLKFKPDVQFVDVKPNGDKIDTIMSFENENVLIQKQINKHPAVIRREFKENDMEMICTATEMNIVGKRWFKLVE